MLTTGLQLPGWITRPELTAHVEAMAGGILGTGTEKEKQNKDRSGVSVPPLADPCTSTRRVTRRALVT